MDVDSRIELNKVVNNIQWDGERAVVRCTDGSVYSAEFVVVTTSLGVLKARHLDLFTPQLPPRKVLAIDNIAYGTLEKIYLEWEQPFWPANTTDWVQYSFLWTDADVAAVTGTEREW